MAHRAALALFVAVSGALADEPRDIFAEIDKDLQTLTEISGLQVHRKVAYDLISRDKVNQFLKDRVKEVTKPEELRAEELTLKKFGLVPQDFDLAKTTVDLLTEQAAAFYDFRKKKLYITDWTPSATRDAALVHELAHALADQNFNLERFIKQGRKSDDGSLARLAVMEGQASWLMSEYLARKMGQSLAKSREALEFMSRVMEKGGEQFPVFERAPLYLRETLVFPYTQGMLFQHAVVEKNGRAGFAEVFRRPPVSTQQILHPERYFSSALPTSPALPSLGWRRGYKHLVEGSIGELDHAILLRQYAGKQAADEVAPHWRGGRYGLLENKGEQRVVLLYVSEWEQPTIARKFLRLYRDILKKKWKKMEVASEAEDHIAGIGDDGYFLVRCQGAVVTSLEGLRSPEQAMR